MVENHVVRLNIEELKELRSADAKLIKELNLRDVYKRQEADNKRIEANGGKKSKRAGYIRERIAEINNLREADKEAQDGKFKKNRFIRRHNLCLLYTSF